MFILKSVLYSKKSYYILNVVLEPMHYGAGETAPHMKSKGKPLGFGTPKRNRFRPGVSGASSPRACKNNPKPLDFTGSPSCIISMDR